jgi:hypothetical protein
MHPQRYTQIEEDYLDVYEFFLLSPDLSSVVRCVFPLKMWVLAYIEIPS